MYRPADYPDCANFPLSESLCEMTVYDYSLDLFDTGSHSARASLNPLAVFLTASKDL